MTRGERTGAAGGCGGGGLTVVVCADSSRFIDERVLAGVRKFLAGATSLHVLLNRHAAVAGVRRRCKGKGQGAPGGAHRDGRDGTRWGNTGSVAANGAREGSAWVGLVRWRGQRGAQSQRRGQSQPGPGGAQEQAEPATTELRGGSKRLGI